jgi:hypothetical protein
VRIKNFKIETCDGYVTIDINRSEEELRPILRPFRDAIVDAQMQTNVEDVAEELTSHLERLSALRASGALDAEEFKAAKARILGL